ncbi:uncharacterized protein LOC132704514 [Cylas formicarius]|uniref:uncharacterized protein LOC132704514 n=1 Tax=Cylas formicarius TaxID=197179 RepID=UPI0029583284|nr:uncharacterized protein LOC132704514 [Cylas formicarius]XP_060530519.1 uncharacterized protein LOC132704514 [Cylas formicarius]
MSVDVELNNLEDALKTRLNGKITKQTVTRLTPPGENFCSLILKVDLDTEENGKKETVHTVVKLLPLQEKFKEMFRSCMKNEIQWYSKIIPLFKEFQEECGFEETSDFFPEMYGGRLSLDSQKTEPDDDSILVLENLIVDGYKNEDRYIGFDLKTSKNILRRLATFHMGFIAMKLKKPELFEKEVKTYLEEMKPPPPPKDGGDPFPNPNEYILKAIGENPECSPLISKLEVVLQHDFFKTVPEIVEPWATVSHSDFWVNNIMVKYEGDDVKIKFVDFQMCRYRSFAFDLIFFLLTSVQTPIQKQYFDELIRYYYFEFVKNLKLFKVDLSLSYEEYLEELKTAASFEVHHSIFFSTIIFGTKNAEYDYSTDVNFDPGNHMLSMVKSMPPNQKEKMAVMTLLAAKRGWLD